MSIYLCEYGNKNTDIYFERDGDCFIVKGQMYSSAGIWRCGIYSTRNYDNALERLESEITIARGGCPARKCAFAGKSDKCDCRAGNCPAELGGLAFWQIFHRSCLYRCK